MALPQTWCEVAAADEGARDAGLAVARGATTAPAPGCGYDYARVVVKDWVQGTNVGARGMDEALVCLHCKYNKQAEMVNTIICQVKIVTLGQYHLNWTWHFIMMSLQELNIQLFIWSLEVLSNILKPTKHLLTLSDMFPDNFHKYLDTSLLQIEPMF